MGKEQNLKPFTSENQPPGASKSRKGIPNRATVFKKFLSMRVEVKDPKNTDENIKVTMYEAAALGQMKAAMDGNPTAWKEIQDSIHGKMVENLNVKAEIRTFADLAKEAEKEIDEQ